MSDKRQCANCKYMATYICLAYSTVTRICQIDGGPWHDTRTELTCDKWTKRVRTPQDKAR